jgi:hypothetical protein
MASFSVEPWEAPGPLPSVEATVNGNTIIVGGGYWVPCDGVLASEIEGAVSVDELGIQIQVSWDGDVNSCSPSVVSFVYQAVIGSVEPGTHSLQVVHVAGDDGFIVLEQDVVVQ